jgi:hypothetical protein
MPDRIDAVTSGRLRLCAENRQRRGGSGLDTRPIEAQRGGDRGGDL